MAKKKTIKATYVVFVYEDDPTEVMLPNGQLATLLDHEENEVTAADLDTGVFRILRGGKKSIIQRGNDIEVARVTGTVDDATWAQRKRWKLEVHPTISFW